MDQHGVARLQGRFVGQGIVSGQKSFGDDRGLSQRQRRRNAHQHALVNRDLGGVAAIGEQSQDVIAELPVPHVSAQGLNRPGKFQARDVVGAGFGGWVVALALHQIRAVEPLGCHGNAHFFPGRNRIGQLANAQDLRAAVLR